MFKTAEMLYDIWADSYDSGVNPQTHMEHEDVLSLVDARQGEVILDLACGTGKYTAEFDKVGATVIGADISSEMLNQARSKSPQIDFRRLDIRKVLPFEESFFYKVNCAQCLAHIADLNFTLTEVNRILKKNAYFIFSVTHPEMYWDDYEIKGKIPVDVREVDQQHKFSDYLSAIEASNLKLDRIVQIPVDSRIKDLLTERSFEKVVGRFQVLVMRLIKI